MPTDRQVNPVTRAIRQTHVHEERMPATTAVRRRRQTPSRKRGRGKGRAQNQSMQTREIVGLSLLGLGAFLAMTLFLGFSVGPVGSG